MAWVTSREEDIRLNEGIILAMKKTLGCKPGDELKYRSIRRHLRKMEVLDHLRNARVEVILSPILKADIKELELKDPRTKRLVVLMHEFPMSALMRNVGRDSPEMYFQLVFDEISWQGCQERIKKEFETRLKADWSTVRRDWLVFLKSGSSAMLQMADVFAGMGREYVESTLVRTLPPCPVCWVKNRKLGCAHRRQAKPVGTSGLLRRLMPHLATGADGRVLEAGFLVRPPHVRMRYLFVDCLK